MSEHVISPATYIAVLVALVLLTIATVGISFVPLESLWHIAAGLAIAAVKASLVVLFFMHALHSPRLTWIVIAIAIAWTMLLFALSFSDYLTRGSIPYMPGH